MDECLFETYKNDNPELEKYLSDSIISYGMEQLKGNKPQKLSCCYRNTQGKIVAGVMGSTTLNMFFISHLYVEPDYRNNGLATKLLSEIEKVAIEAGCNILRLNTFNRKTHDLYIRNGFQKTVCIPNYMDSFDLVYFHKKIK